jgi:asparagine synthase (glutamine-hydrolysing)
MCGIAGLITQAPLDDGDKEILKRMARTMVHRGPDGEGFYFDDRAGLAHRRLSIIDLEGGKQPMSNEDGTVWVTFNGEIYNYVELREALERKGHRFKTDSDTETIVHLYEEHGVDFPKFLRGMFAVGLWDRRERRLVLSRDRLGKKPLFYGRVGDNFYFASELKALLEAPGFQRDIDPEALTDYFSLLYIAAPKTIYKSVKKVRPAHTLVIDGSGMKELCYWDLDFNQPEEKSEERWCEDLLSTYEEAVRLRLRSDVPLGAFLSGGVDSSSVVALMHRIGGQRLNTCSIGFDEKEFDESAHAAAFAKSLGTEHHEDRVRPEAVKILDLLAWHYDEPFADSSAVPTYYVSQAARRHVTVALSGDGGDENFAGYRRYFHDCLENWARSFFPASFRTHFFGALGRWYPKLDWAPRPLRGQATFRALSRNSAGGYFYSVSGIKPEIKAELLCGDFTCALDGYDPLLLFQDYYDRQAAADHLSRLQYLDIKTYLVDDILVKVDRASMANSLEVRCPILDHKFMEVAARIPPSLKLKGTQGKYIFKQSLRAVLPNEILTRPKQGFAMPLGDWFRSDLKRLGPDLLLTPDPLGVVDSAAVRRIWEKHQSGLRDFSTPLWAILMYRLWHRTFIQNQSAVRSD